MWLAFKVLCSSVFKSFFADKGGFSARKLSAFVSVSIAQIITLRFTSVDNVRDLVATWLIFALLCLGIVTIEQVIALKNGKKDEQPKPDSPQ